MLNMHGEDRELVVDILNNISWSINIVSKRFIEINSQDDFLDSDDGIEKLDSICMQLINIG